MRRFCWSVLLVFLGFSSNFASGYEVVSRVGMMNFVLVKEGVSRHSLLLDAGRVCSGYQVCIAMFWTDRRLIPTSMPMSDDQARAKYAHYNLNKNTRLERLLICSEDGC